MYQVRLSGFPRNIYMSDCTADLKTVEFRLTSVSSLVGRLASTIFCSTLRYGTMEIAI